MPCCICSCIFSTEEEAAFETFGNFYLFFLAHHAIIRFNPGNSSRTVHVNIPNLEQCLLSLQKFVLISHHVYLPACNKCVIAQPLCLDILYSPPGFTRRSIYCQSQNLSTNQNAQFLYWPLEIRLIIEWYRYVYSSKCLCSLYKPCGKNFVW